jgi:TolB-like protein
VSRARIGIRLTVILLFAAGLAGCAAPTRLYVNPQADLTLYRKVAVLPFTNLSAQTFAGERVSRAFTTELIMTDRFQVVEAGELAQILDRTGGGPDTQGRYDPDKLKDACQKLQVTGYVQGAVTEYQMQRSGQEEIPVLSFDAELVDVATGNTVWRVSISRHGKGLLHGLGGASLRSLGALTQRACREAVASLRGKAI